LFDISRIAHAGQVSGSGELSHVKPYFQSLVFRDSESPTLENINGNIGSLLIPDGSSIFNSDRFLSRLYHVLKLRLELSDRAAGG
jgi:hypothetical protein